MGPSKRGNTKKGNFPKGKVVPTTRSRMRRVIVRVVGLPKKEISFLGSISHGQDWVGWLAGGWISKKGNFFFRKVFLTVRDWTSRLIKRAARSPKKEISFLGKIPTIKFPKKDIFDGLCKQVWGLVQNENWDAYVSRSCDLPKKESGPTFQKRKFQHMPQMSKYSQWDQISKKGNFDGLHKQVIWLPRIQKREHGHGCGRCLLPKPNQTDVNVA